MVVLCPTHLRQTTALRAISSLPQGQAKHLTVLPGGIWQQGDARISHRPATLAAPITAVFHPEAWTLS